MRVVVMGGGVAGLATGLVCAREGHQVLICERDDETAPEDPRDAPNWRLGL